MGPHSNTVKLDNHNSNSPIENRHRSEKLFEHLHFRPQKKSQTMFIIQGKATNHPWEDTIIWDSNHLHFDQTPLPWLGAMSRSSLRTGFSSGGPSTEAHSELEYYSCSECFVLPGSSEFLQK